MIGDDYRLQATTSYGPRWTLQLERRRAQASGTAMHDIAGPLRHRVTTARITKLN